MQSNLEIDTNSDKGDISKKFWAHVKATSKQSRIPESVKYKNTFKSEAKDKANLFNSFFYDQFSSPSDYNIKMNFDCPGNFSEINVSKELV